MERGEWGGAREGGEEKERLVNVLKNSLGYGEIVTLMWIIRDFEYGKYVSTNSIRELANKLIDK